VDFVGAMFYCPHALAGGNKRIQIREKTLEFSAVLSMLSLYHQIQQQVKDNKPTKTTTSNRRL